MGGVGAAGGVGSGPGWVSTGRGRGRRPTRRRGTIALALAASLALGASAACSGASRSAEPTADCDRSGCTDIPLAQIEEISGLDLPEGTEVVESSYRSFMDWYLGATLLLPEGAEDPIAASELDWEGAPDDEGVYRSVETSTEDGRLTLTISVFTT